MAYQLNCTGLKGFVHSVSMIEMTHLDFNRLRAQQKPQMTSKIGSKLQLMPKCKKKEIYIINRGYAVLERTIKDVIFLYFTFSLEIVK